MIFISSALQQPRHQKRIITLSSTFACEILYFERDKYKVNYKGLENSATCIGKMSDGKYLSRFGLFAKLYLLLIKNKRRYVYCTSLDQALISILAKKKVIMELGDVLQVSSKPSFYRPLDKWISKRLSGLVLTSPFYWSNYYKEINAIQSKDCLVIENKLPESLREEIIDFRNKVVIQELSDKIKIGVIGSLAFTEPLKILAELAEQRKDIEIHVFGDGALDIFEGRERCFVYGPFKNPDDLQDIYEKIDINYVVYDSEDNNVKIALPNKLYESIAFCKPVICASNVALADIVTEKGIGVSSDLDGINNAINEIHDNYVSYLKKILELGEAEYLDLTKTELLNFVKERFKDV